jgi:hypothetical protein
MQFTVIANPRASHQVQHQEALAQGLRAHGIDAVLSSSDRSRTKYVACWGWRIGKLLRNAGHEVLVMERGYLGNRFEWTSLAWNGLNGRGTFPPAPRDNGERFKKHFCMLPWKSGGEYALIMGQVPGDASLQGRNLVPWYRQAAEQAAEAYGLPVHFRPHPVALRKGHRHVVSGTIRSAGALESALAQAAVVITYNSNSGVDSVLAGVPTVAVDEGSMASPVVAKNIGEMITPNRERWAAELAWKLDEIASGVALTNLLEINRG